MPFDSTSYLSPLSVNASVTWAVQEFHTSSGNGRASVFIDLTHKDIEWDFLRSIYGWAILQYQSWARGSLLNSSPRPIKIALFPTNAFELWVNDQHIFGADFYGFERAPVVLTLNPGHNVVNLRLIRDVRANGGSSPPSIEATLRVETLQGSATVLPRSVLVPDVVNGRFISALGSVTILNHAKKDVYVESIALSSSGRKCQLSRPTVCIRSGQSRPVPFRLGDIDDVDKEVLLKVRLRLGGQTKVEEHELPIRTVHHSATEAQKFTFQHPSGAVSYAELRPPADTHGTPSTQSLPVIVALHGSGVDADSDMARHSFDAAKDLPAWIVFPTGTGPWCGDDWHTWAQADVDAALAAVPDWTHENVWPGPGADLKRIIVTGHSNGGHGTWHMALHQPDRIVAAAAASGYSSIENYVPFTMWNTMEPAKAAILSSARSSFQQELFISNLKSTPMLVQHGGDDHNVPAYHSRLMKSIAAGHSLDFQLAEFEGKGHWWDGVMTTKPMLKFFREHLTDRVTTAWIPDNFTLTTADDCDFGSMHGINIEQHRSPDMLASVTVATVLNPDGQRLSTLTIRNVRRLRIDVARFRRSQVDGIHVDGHQVWEHSNGPFNDLCLLLDQDRWESVDCEQKPRLNERSGRQRGAMHAILRSRGSFGILACREAEELAIQTSRNLLQYYGADAEIKIVPEQHQEGSGNLITIWQGKGLPSSKLAGFPIQVLGDVVHLERDRRDGSSRALFDVCAGAWLRPLEDEKLELVIWGIHQRSLRHAARMVSTLTGGGQPEFVLFGCEGRHGLDNIVATGFFDYAWNISARSYVPW